MQIFPGIKKIGFKYFYLNQLASIQRMCHAPFESATNIPLHRAFEHLVWKCQIWAGDVSIYVLLGCEYILLDTN